MEEIATVYARSLVEVAIEQDKLDVIREEIGEFADALSETRELQVFFFSPYFSTEEKKDGLERAVTGADEAVAEQIGEEIGRQTGRKVELTSTVDPDVLGGIVVRVGNSILDASIRTRLERLRKQVARA